MSSCRPYKPQKISFSESKPFHVFLSFRGPDVRKTLADHLYHSLSTAGLRVFIDSEELLKGENIERNLELAIKGSSIYIPIFSPAYASSPWCLREVSLMWEIRSRSADTVALIPLFHNVKPSHVRYPHRDGPYAEAFETHVRNGRHSQGEIQGWRNALHGVSCLSGWSLEETSFGYEGKLVKQVVKDVLQTLDVGVLDVARRPVGLTSLCEEVIQLLRLGDKATHGRRTLGIWGMPGLGKTTLSKALYNKIHHLFDASCFVSNVKEEGSKPRLKELKQKIVRDLLKMPKEVNRIDDGITQRNNLAASLRVLVVLDDVDNVLQLDALIGNWFGEGSRIIITTQDKHVLEARQVDEIYPMRKLEHAEAVELFCWHAFLSDHPKKGYEYLTERIVKACSGLPLSLEIVGEDLYNRNESRYWKQTLDKLEKVGNDLVFETLKISYDSLTLEVKRIFLDIACFFVNLKSSLSLRNRAFDMCFYDKFWCALGCVSVYPSLKTLEEKSLIAVHEYRYCEDPDEDIDEEELAGQYLCEFSMHEEIRRMGWRIVREESLSYPTDRSRIWQEDIHNVIAAMTIQENSRVEGLLWRRQIELQRIDNLAQLRRLNFLLWWKLHLKTEIQRLPTNLKYLILSECQLKTCSSKDLNHLEQLDLSVSSGEELHGDTQPLVGRRNLTMQRGNSTVAILFCFVFNLNQRVRLPQMDVVMTFLGENPDCPYFRAFKLPSCATEGHESGKDILRVCVCKAGWSSPAVPFCGGGTLSCSYSLPDHLSQCGSPVLLQQVELLLLERDATPQITTRLLREWKLLSSLSDVAEEEREVVSIERGFTSQIVTMSACNDIGEEREVTDNVGEETEEREVSGTEREETEVASIERSDSFQFITELFPELDLRSSSNCTAGERTEVSNIETDAAYEMATQIWQERVWVPFSSDNLEESVVADNVGDATA